MIEIEALDVHLHHPIITRAKRRVCADCCVTCHAGWGGSPPGVATRRDGGEFFGSPRCCPQWCGGRRPGPSTGWGKPVCRGATSDVSGPRHDGNTGRGRGGEEVSTGSSPEKYATCVRHA